MDEGTPSLLVTYCAQFRDHIGYVNGQNHVMEITLGTADEETLLELPKPLHDFNQNQQKTQKNSLVLYVAVSVCMFVPV